MKFKPYAFAFAALSAVLVCAPAPIRAQASTPYLFAQSVLKSLPLISWGEHFMHPVRTNVDAAEFAKLSDEELTANAMKRVQELKTANQWLEDVKSAMAEHLGSKDPAVKLVAGDIYGSAQMLISSGERQMNEMRIAARAPDQDRAILAQRISDSNADLKSSYLLLLQSVSMVLATLSESFEQASPGRIEYKISPEERAALVSEIEHRFGADLALQDETPQAQPSAILSIAGHLKRNLARDSR